MRGGSLALAPSPHPSACSLSPGTAPSEAPEDDPDGMLALVRSSSLRFARDLRLHEARCKPRC